VVAPVPVAKALRDQSARVALVGPKVNTFQRAFMLLTSGFLMLP